MTSIHDLKQIVRTETGRDYNFVCCGDGKDNTQCVSAALCNYEMVYNQKLPQNRLLENLTAEKVYGVLKTNCGNIISDGSGINFREIIRYVKEHYDSYVIAHTISPTPIYATKNATDPKCIVLVSHMEHLYLGLTTSILHTYDKKHLKTIEHH